MYFTFYSFVYIKVSVKEQEVLIKNTENGFVQIINNKIVVDYLASITPNTINYGVELTPESYSDKEVYEVFRNLEYNMCGEFVPETADKAPIQFSPQLKIKNLTYTDDIPDFYQKDDSFSLSVLNDIGKNILYNVLELSIYYSTNPNPDLKEMNVASSQYLYPIISDKLLKLDCFELLFRYEYPKLSRINLILGDINLNDLDKINTILKDRELASKTILYTSEDVYAKLPPQSYEAFSSIKVWNYWSSDNKDIECLYLEKDLSQLISLENNKPSAEIYPLFTGDNIQECTEYLSYSKEDILVENISEDEIFINQYINSNFYGELSIFPDGSVYSRKNTPPLGNLYKDDIKHLLLLEICKYKNWFMTREKIGKCKDCVLNCLCPPITLLEIGMNNATLCTH